MHGNGVKRKWFVRSLGPDESFQSVGDQTLQLGVDDGVSFTLSLNEWHGVCGHARSYHHMCEFKHISTDVCPRTVSQCHRQTTVVHFHDTCDTL
jgi:hypothetical protein